MGKYCPIVKGKVTYLICLECEEKECEKEREKEEEKTQSDTGC